ncbi:hypothetical protein P2G88_12520 [Aliiglaciecola sp. CAU 1673]|uniref:hypothetical protein n=1 Tax=Aliiglaciecola sp. CAU 1673 TaxID=3032595 RepID=UPI0023D9C751|nr:hypothetical protein [Aliiglaciecola sp. CAU 1673]MDF2179076.1 hypothetical protein [Aliiglaciecola sp. CAU 1673]
MSHLIKHWLVVALMLGSWLLTFWIQWQTEMPMSMHVIGVPLLMLMVAGLAGLALEEEDH